MEQCIYPFAGAGSRARAGEPAGMGTVKQNSGKSSGEVSWETMVLPLFAFSEKIYFLSPAQFRWQILRFYINKYNIKY